MNEKNICVKCNKEIDDDYYWLCEECHGEEMNNMIEENRREPPDSELGENSED